MPIYAYWKGAGGGKPLDPEDPDGVWTPENPIIVRVTFNGNGDKDNTSRAISVLKYEPINVAQRAPQVTRSGYKSDGWSTAQNNAGTRVTTLAPDRDTMLYALWTQDSDTSTGGGGSGVPNPGPSSIVSSKPYDIKDPEVPFSPNIPDEFINDHIKYINGYPDGTMRPDSAITRAETAAIIFRLLKSESKNRALDNPFTDVPDYEWHAQSIKYLADTNIVCGYPNGSFMPDEKITRAEFAKMVSGYDNLNITTGNQFSDTAGHWAEGYINSAANRGWVSGYPDGSFRPENNITRAEVVSTINRMLQRNIAERDVPSWARRFSDMTADHWAYLAVVEAATAHDYIYNADGTEKWSKSADTGN
jgi:hypothetical protein